MRGKRGIDVVRRVFYGKAVFARNLPIPLMLVDSRVVDGRWMLSRLLTVAMLLLSVPQACEAGRPEFLFGLSVFVG